MVPFAIGSETAGSITYPAARCGVTAFRPTFGTVGRTGVLSLSESLVRDFLLDLYIVLGLMPLQKQKLTTISILIIHNNLILSSPLDWPTFQV